MKSAGGTSARPAGLPGGFLIDGRYGRHLFLVVAHPVYGKELVVSGVGEDPPFVGDGILAGDHGADAWESFGLAGVDVEDAGVGVRASQYLAMQHAREG